MGNRIAARLAIGALALLVGAAGCSQSEEESGDTWAPELEGLFSQEARDAYRALHSIPEHADERLKEDFERFRERSRMAAYLASGPRRDDWQARIRMQQRVNESLIGYHVDQRVAEQMTEERVQEYYEAHKDEYGNKRYHLAHILLTDRGGQAEDSPSARMRARTLYEKLEQGAGFTELARKHSQDSNSAQNGGKIGWLDEDGMAEYLREAVSGLEAGEVSSPVESSRGWHLVKLLEPPKGKTPAFEVVADQVRYDVRQNLEQKVKSKLRKEALNGE